MPHKMELKKRLLDVCWQMQQGIVNNAKEAMDLAQESANEEKGALEHKFESFREQMQIDRDMYAKQYQEAVNNLNILMRMEPHIENDYVKLGSVLITSEQKFFVSVSLGAIKIDDEIFYAISVQSPVFQAFAGKKQGDTFTFRNKKQKIVEHF